MVDFVSGNVAGMRIADLEVNHWLLAANSFTCNIRGQLETGETNLDVAVSATWTEDIVCQLDQIRKLEHHLTGLAVLVLGNCLDLRLAIVHTCLVSIAGFNLAHAFVVGRVEGRFLDQDL